MSNMFKLKNSERRRRGQRCGEEQKAPEASHSQQQEHFSKNVKLQLFSEASSCSNSEKTSAVN